MPPKILIADDEAYIRLLLVQTLEEIEEQGVDLLTAEDGQAALDLIRTQAPDLVFLDVMMPCMNGFEVCRAARALEPREPAPYIVILTAKGQEYDRKQGEESGADLFMTKPFDPDAVIALAARVLGRS